MTEKKAQSSREKLEKLRAGMAQAGLQGIVIEHDDEHLNEFPPESGNRLRYVTDFSGSAGEALVLTDKALMLSDQRYTRRLQEEVDASCFMISDMRREKQMDDWIAELAPPGAKIGYDPRTCTAKTLEAMRKAGSAKEIEFIPFENGNPVDLIWTDKPPLPASKARLFSDSADGRTAAQKRAMIAEEIKKLRCKAVVLAKAESTNWLLNVRGRDLECTPFVMGHVLVYDDGRVDWFIEADRTDDVRQHLGAEITIRAPGEMEDALKDLALAANKEKKSVLVDSERTPVWYRQTLRKAGARVKDEMDPCVEPRAIKTPAQQAAIREAHIRDGVAMVRSLKWWDEEAPKGKLTEMDVVRKLEEFRAMDDSFICPSFTTIAGWNANGADIHREVTEKNNTAIKPPGVLLLDSGGQYKNLGTTDITRVLSVGSIDRKICEDYTLVLMGAIDLAMTEFPQGEKGVHLDAIARKPLWKARKDYGHGTGHGVGQEGGVHEEGSTISKRADPKGLFLKPGMLHSDEPGFYSREYGIRIEDLKFVVKRGVCVVNEGKTVPMYGFDVITMCPKNRDLIIPEMLSAEQLQWLNDYHATVWRTLSPRLTEEEKKWLRQATEPLKKNVSPAPACRVPGLNPA